MPFPYQGRKTNCNLLNFRSLKTFAPGHSFHFCPDFCCCSGWLHTSDSDWAPVCLQLYFMASQLLLRPPSFLPRCSSKVACMQTTTFESERTWQLQDRTFPRAEQKVWEKSRFRTGFLNLAEQLHRSTKEVGVCFRDSFLLLHGLLRGRVQRMSALSPQTPLRDT